MNSELKQRTLQKLADAYSRKELRPNPEYQRGAYKWTLAQKQKLLDSMLRGYQIPLFYVHLIQKVHTFTDSVETTAELVDGQQRLAAIVSYLQNEFSLPNPQIAVAGAEMPRWSGRKFEELEPEDKACLLGRELLVVQMTADSRNEVRDLFIRLQAGTLLTAQEKRDTWPGEFTNFVIRHAGKPGHPLHNPKAFFTLFPRSRRLSVDDEEHYVDGVAFPFGLRLPIKLIRHDKHSRSVSFPRALNHFRRHCVHQTDQRSHVKGSTPVCGKNFLAC
jgi:hypothetical protein